ncbi:uncharacterized protein BT62DRAFT_476262 [Guyanagaster necrorhizus]|uniref:LysM domain-containing protein n=1 Tax=Guyanagaster necrorhizus TaxID=856835 RepID=A0A9P8AN89_9AGAR|nr:uncharacterized protein BT62DRAFT_476262 [Guyanagaster necrorhizus MCA 3950]KAG7441620.1 hypothetical protein BT62DRAFT_476262 [Guyanagaster necrorhizus MCA 3950]
MFILTGLALLFTTGFRFSAAQVANCARNYTVQLGDTCNAISAAQKVSTYQLAQVNTYIDERCTNLVLGQVLCLGIVDKDCTETYVMASGDHCATIAVAENTTYDVILANNPNVDSTCDNLYPGEVLCVASKNVYT